MGLSGLWLWYMTDPSCAAHWKKEFQAPPISSYGMLKVRVLPAVLEGGRESSPPSLWVEDEAYLTAFHFLATVNMIIVFK